MVRDSHGLQDVEVLKKNKTFIKSLGRRARFKYFELKITVVSFGIRIYSDCMYVFRFYV